MSIKELSNYTYYSKYARYNKEAKRRETWAEAIDRVKKMHLKKYADRIKLYPEIKEEIEWAFEQSRQKRVLGSQRALQFGGDPILKTNPRIYNCTTSYCDRIRFFQEALWMLLCGCGVGFSVQTHHVAQLPSFSTKNYSRNGKQSVKKFLIPDSIEGWSDALGVLLASYFPHEEFLAYEGYYVEFDYSLIRLAGSPISSGSGKAPGPEPLRRSLEIIRGLLDSLKEKGQTRLRPIDAYDIVMHASDAVLSGGVRRSATICLFSPDDKEMATAKTGNWFSDNPQRGRSNNSAVLLRNCTKKEDFLRLIESVKQFGEPGFVWADDLEITFNPCVVGDTVVVTKDGLATAEGLKDKCFTALVDGITYQSERQGFWLTGVKKVIELEFSSNRRLKLTANHKIMTTAGWKQAADITSEDEVVINNHREFIPEIDQKSEDFAQGYCLGNFLGDGNISGEASQMKWWGENKEDYRAVGLNLIEQAGWKNNHHKEFQSTTAVYSSIYSSKLLDFAKSKDCFTNGDKRLSKQGICGNWSYLAGLISGYFDADGTVAHNPKKGSSVRICSSQMDNLLNLQIVLNAFGIFSKIYTERYPAGMRPLPDGKGGRKDYYCEATHELCISCDNIMRFFKLIPVQNLVKFGKIRDIVESYHRMPNRTSFVDKVIKVNQLEAQPVYDANINDIHAFDANGVYVHNCVEIALYPRDDEGNSGWAVCNLCEINGRKIKSKEDWQIAARAGAIIGTLQAGYTDFGYLGLVSKRIAEREALLGVSITGMMDNPEILFDPALQREMAALVVKTNEAFAPLLGINKSARSTCIKPSGTTSCVLGTGSGVHPHHAKRYLRRIQGNILEAPLLHFKKFNPHAVEKSVWSANGTDEVISFCIEVPDGGKTKNDLDAVTLLEHVKLTQNNWVAAGCVKERCAKPWLMHNVSNTINVKPDEWAAVADFIYDNRQHFSGISLLPISGDKDYPQAPMCTIFSPRELVQMYGDGMPLASGLIVDGLHAFSNNLWKACDAALGHEPLAEPAAGDEASIHIDFLSNHKRWEAQVDWVRRAKQFASRYFAGDVRQMTYCLKDVNNWKTFLDLKRDYVDVDYTTMLEESDETVAPLLEPACAGGLCMLG